jgi:hypothetical protein
MSVWNEVIGPVGNCSSSFDEVRKNYLLSNGVNTQDFLDDDEDVDDELEHTSGKIMHKTLWQIQVCALDRMENRKP